MRIPSANEAMAPSISHTLTPRCCEDAEAKGRKEEEEEELDGEWLLVWHYPVTHRHQSPPLSTATTTTTTTTPPTSTTVAVNELTPPPSPPPLQARELTWLLDALHETLKTLKSSLEETYALLAPIDPGATLVVSTPKHETVKGYVTRVGTRLVKGQIALRLRTVPNPIVLSLNPDKPIHIPELTTLNTLLTQSVDILSFVVSESFPQAKKKGEEKNHGNNAEPRFVSSQLRLLSEYLAEASALIKGPELPNSADQNTPHVLHNILILHRTGHLFFDDTPTPRHDLDALLGPPTCFSPPLNSSSQQPGSGSSSHHHNLSVYLTIQDASLVLYVRALEPADAPVNFGTKLALAIGTARRLEHDEADRVFGYCPEGADDPIATEGSTMQNPPNPLAPPPVQRVRSSNNARGGGMGKGRGTEQPVYVREKVRVVSTDPSLLSLSSKLGALGNALALARRNLAVVMGELDEVGGE
ncbi:RAVE subunit 2/Rogdi [Apiospora saccharicola]